MAGAQAAAGYAEYDPDTSQFRLSAEQAFALTDEYNPLFFPGGFQGAAAAIKDVELITDAFRDGHGVAWGDHHPDLFVGTDRFFRPNYLANLTASWIPALDGVEPKLQAGATVADIGCGYGASTIIMATAYPASSFIGYDPHPPSIEAARKAAADAGVADRCRFDVATATDYSGRDYDLVTLFDCLHDMGDPVGAAGHIRETLSDDGTCLLVEPFAEDRLEDNLTPIGRIFYADRPCFAHPVLAPNKSAWHSVHRPAHPGCATCSTPPDSPEFDGQPRPPSTSYSKPDADPPHSRTSAFSSSPRMNRRVQRARVPASGVWDRRI